jgi:hypothetical protein
MGPKCEKKFGLPHQLQLKLGNHSSQAARLQDADVNTTSEIKRPGYKSRERDTSRISRTPDSLPAHARATDTMKAVVTAASRTPR